MKKLFLILLASATSLSAQTLANCNQATVQTALNAISSNGTVITCPSGSYSWAANSNPSLASVTVTTSYSFTFQGASVIATTNGQGNPATFTDNTIITDTQATGGPGVLNITLTGPSTQVVRVTGFTWKQTNEVYNGEISLGTSSSTPGQARFDHNHIYQINDLAIGFYQPLEGVIDHSLFDVPNGDVWNGVRVYNEYDGYGHAAWAATTPKGTSANVFLENDTFNNGFVNDCVLGGTMVVRYSTLNVLASGQNSSIQSHATGSQPQAQRGCRSIEVYNNVFGGGGGTIVDAPGYLTSGTVLWWGNTTTNAQHGIQVDEDRDQGNSSCGGAGTYCQGATPSGWGYCGTAFNGTGSAWDGNTSTSTGYPCIDQIGRGQGQLLSGTFTALINTVTGTIAWPNQALEPLYAWMETYSGSGSYMATSSINNNIQANRDYYIPNSSFNGSSGTGYGLYSAIPATCTPLTAYWATDQNKLYQCATTNTWTAYYTPYVYPHPLDTNGGIASPTNLSGNVKFGGAGLVIQ